MVGPLVPHIILVVVGVLVGTSALLSAATVVVWAYTRFRRAVRRERIFARAEGWGGPGHRNQELDVADEHPVFKPLAEFASGLTRRRHDVDDDARKRASGRT
jgi:hypothetical protein